MTRGDIVKDLFKKTVSPVALAGVLFYAWHLWMTCIDYSRKQIIDTSDSKFQDNTGLRRWDTIENFKIASQTYNEFSSISQSEHKITTLNEMEKAAKQTLVKVEHRMKELAEIIKYTEQYKMNHPYQLRYVCTPLINFLPTKNINS